MKRKMKGNLVLLAVLSILVSGFIFVPEVLIRGVKNLVVMNVLIGKNLSALFGALKGGIPMNLSLLIGVGVLVGLSFLFLRKKVVMATISAFLSVLIGFLFYKAGINIHSIGDVVIVVGTVFFTFLSLKVGKKMDLSNMDQEGMEKKEWKYMALTWTIPFALISAAIIWYTTGFLSIDVLGELILRWLFRGLVIGLTVLYYGWPMFSNQWVVGATDKVVREFAIAESWNRKFGTKLKVLRPLPEGLYYYLPLVFLIHKESGEIEKVKIPISQILSQRARKEMKELEDRIMLDKAILSVRYRITDLKKLVPVMGRKKAKDYLRDEAISLLRAQIGVKSLAATLKEWRDIEKVIKEEMALFRSFGVKIVSVLITNLKVPRTENKKEETQETPKEKQTTSSDDDEDKAADKPKPKKKGIAGLGLIVVLIVAAIIIANAIGNVGRPKETQQVAVQKKSGGYKLMVPFPVQQPSKKVTVLSGRIIIPVLSYSDGDWNEYGIGWNYARKTSDEIWGRKVGHISYTFRLKEVGDYILNALLSSELDNTTSSRKKDSSDVTLTVNGIDIGTKNIITDNAKGRVYNWRISASYLKKGRNIISFVVKKEAKYKNGLVIYTRYPIRLEPV